MDKLNPLRGQAISVAAHLARGTRLKAIRDLCEGQRTVSTGKLEFMADNLANCMKSDAVLIREISDYAEAADTELAAAKARIAELEEGLEPFAKLNDSLPGSDYIGSAPLDAELRLTRDDLRHAAALLKEKE